jgi:hypothetical protein
MWSTHHSLRDCPPFIAAMSGFSDKLGRLVHVETATLKLPAITLLWRTLAELKRCGGAPNRPENSVTPTPPAILQLLF